MGLVIVVSVLSGASVAYAQQGDLTAAKNPTSTSIGHAVSGTTAQPGNAANAAAPTQSKNNINADSEYATGEGLNGPPAHFPAADTPE
jgi:hypothetical protein